MLATGNRRDAKLLIASMIRALRSIISVALGGITSITLAYGTSTSTASSTAQSPASTRGPSSIEVDVIFPIHNTTYNITESLPIVFALQNLTAAAALGSFTFEWDIMPYGNVAGDQGAGGVVNDYWSTTFSTANQTPTEPYILVNQTNVQKWQYKPETNYFGSVYALQWLISWNVPLQPCDSDPLGAFGTLFFNININSPEPDLGDLIGRCPQLGNTYEINTTAKNSSCSAVVSNSISSSGSGGSEESCAVTLDKAMVGNISSAVQSLVAASAAAASAATATSASATGTPSPARHNIAVSSDVPLLYVLVATFLASLQMVISL
jgi:hypothetical protein